MNWSAFCLVSADGERERRAQNEGGGAQCTAGEGYARLHLAYRFRCSRTLKAPEHVAGALVAPVMSFSLCEPSPIDARNAARAEARARHSGHTHAAIGAGFVAVNNTESKRDCAPRREREGASCEDFQRPTRQCRPIRMRRQRGTEWVDSATTKSATSTRPHRRRAGGEQRWRRAATRHDVGATKQVPNIEARDLKDGRPAPAPKHAEGEKRREMWCVSEIEAVMANSIVQGSLTTMLFLSLYLPDVWMLVNPSNDADVGLNTLLFACYAAFNLEMVLLYLARDEYRTSFFFAMDMLHAVDPSRCHDDARARRHWCLWQHECPACRLANRRVRPLGCLCGSPLAFQHEGRRRAPQRR